MIITRTPFRVSFVGGGSDLPSFSQKYGGAVLSTTINKYMHVSLHPYFNRSMFSLKYSKNELVDSVHTINHPIIKETLKHLDIRSGIEVTTTADIPSGTGLGSSSAFTVGLLNALYAYKSRLVTKEQLAREACMIEIDKVGSPIGKQDQYASSFGGLNTITFEKDGTVKVHPVVISSSTKKALEDNLLLFYTKSERDANDVLKEQSSLMEKDKKTEVMRKMVDLVPELNDSLTKGDLSTFGELLHKNWMLKKSITSAISTLNIDKYYELGMNNGALGGKLLGAGGGGFLLFYCEQHKQERLRKALSDLSEMKFAFDNYGTKLIYFTEDSVEEEGFFSK